MDKLRLKAIITPQGWEFESLATYIFENIDITDCEYSITKYNEAVALVNSKYKDKSFLKKINESTQTADEIRDTIVDNDETLENLNL